jgi:hypothetical protein
VIDCNKSRSNSNNVTQTGLKRHDPGLPMTDKSPLFNVGEIVLERSSTARERGVVMETYVFEGDYRYVVKFDSDREAVFFEHELVTDQESPKT